MRSKTGFIGGILLIALGAVAIANGYGIIPADCPGLGCYPTLSFNVLGHMGFVFVAVGIITSCRGLFKNPKIGYVLAGVLLILLLLVLGYMKVIWLER